jgi:predicted phage baseplate assembly protein
VWVRWTSRPHLHDSGAADRHYLIERASGLVMFGDGRHGMIPSAGSRLTLSYESGGGLAGNLPAGAIAELRTAVPYVMGASNPAPSSGGAPIESLPSVRARGSQRLRHRDRALTPQDFEWMARDASPEIARARCLPITGPDGYAQRGWVTVLIVPQSTDAQPSPTVEVRRRVRDYLVARAPASVARRVRVEAPRYVAVSVSAELVPLSASSAALIDARVRARLNYFLHPLTGGIAREGWNFGETVHVSQIASIIEGTDGVDYARDISLNVGGRIVTESIPIQADMLIASGDHELKLVAGVA